MRLTAWTTAVPRTDCGCSVSGRNTRRRGDQQPGKRGRRCRWAAGVAGGGAVKLQGISEKRADKTADRLGVGGGDEGPG